MRLDWYSATVPVTPALLLEAVADGLGASVQRCRPLHGYAQGFEFRRDDTVIARMLAGGNNDANPHAWASGDDTMEFVGVVRNAFPVHNVSRIDSAEDVSKRGAYDELFRVCRSVKAETGVSGRQIVPDEQGEGRTYYMGSPASAVRIRLYEKGKQWAAQIVKSASLRPTRIQSSDGKLHDVEDWTRLEVQVRPEGTAKQTMATASAEAVWGASRWTRVLADRAMGLQIPPVEMRVWHERDDDRALRFMAQQYGAMLIRLRDDCGDWKAAGMTIGDLVEEVQRRRRSR